MLLIYPFCLFSSLFSTFEIESHFEFSRLILFFLVLSCLVLSCLVLSCLVLSCLVLSCLVFCFIHVLNTLCTKLQSRSCLISPRSNPYLILCSQLFLFRRFWRTLDGTPPTRHIRSSSFCLFSFFLFFSLLSFPLLC